MWKTHQLTKAELILDAVVLISGVCLNFYGRSLAVAGPALAKT